MKMQKIKKWLISTVLCTTMTVGLATPAMAADLREEKAAAEADLAVAEASATEEFKLNLSAVADVDEEEVELTDEDGDTVDTEEMTAAEEATDTDGIADADQLSEVGTSAASVDEKAATEALQQTAQAESTSGKYIKELRVSSGAAEEAKKKLRDNDYVVIDQNLNEGGTPVYLGYKTTDNVAEAVRDIAAMNLSDGYTIVDYETIMLKKYKEFAPIEKNYVSILQEYRENYYLQSPYAVASHDLLNLFYEDDTNQNLGDYLLSVDLRVSNGKSISELAEFVTGISNAANATVVYLLSFSLVSYDTKTFLQVLSEMSENEINAAKENPLYSDSADALEEAMDSYAEFLLDSEETITAYDSGQAVTYSGDLESTREILEELASLSYGNKTLLDYLTDEDRKDGDLSPLASVLSPGQVAAVEMVGPELLAEWEIKNYSIGSENGLTALRAEIEQFKTDFINDFNETKGQYGLEINADKPLSIYSGVDRSTMQGTIAITEDAASYMRAMGTSPFETAGNVFAAIMGVALGSFLVVSVFISYSVRTLQSVKVLNRALAGLAVLLTVSLVSLIMMSIMYGMSDDQYEVSRIPDVLIEKRTDVDGNSYFVRYNAVNSFETYKDEPVPGDLNGGNGSTGTISHVWDVLYTSTEIEAGDPIQAKYKTASSARSYLESDLYVHQFGTVNAHNLNEYSEAKNAGPIYLCFTQGLAGDYAGSIFGSTAGQIAIFIIGILLGAALMAVAQVLGRRRKKAVA